MGRDTQSTALKESLFDFNCAKKSTASLHVRNALVSLWSRKFLMAFFFVVGTATAAFNFLPLSLFILCASSLSAKKV